jgi:serine/threonine-protein kinase
MIGRTIGHYRIVEQLGRGGSGTVYRAVDATLDREVAIKVLNPELVDTDAMRRFQSEATILAKLNHPSIATIYELFHSEADLLMVMELVRGKTLERTSDELGPLPPDRAAPIIERILSALAHAHHAGVVHRDLKPANIMVTDTGVVKLMDFGIARVRGADRLTIDGAMLGTPAYMAPEQVLSQDIDGRTDLYSVGVIFYRLLTNALPFEAKTPIAMMQRQLSDAPTPLSLHREHLPAWCEVIMQRALAKAPAGRYQTAEEFRDALAASAGLAPTGDLAKLCAIAASCDQHAAAPRERVHTIVLPSADVKQRVGTRRRAASRRRRRIINILLGARSAVRSRRHEWLPILRRNKRLAGFSLMTVAAIVILFALFARRPATDGIVMTLQPRDSSQRRVVKTDSGRLVFSGEALVGTGRWVRRRNARVILADGTITVISDDDRKPMHSVPYESVTSINYSNSHDPMWRSPKGPARITRTNGGVLDALGIIVDRHWISLGTSAPDRFIVLSVAEAQVHHALSALEERTGLITQRVGEPTSRRSGDEP